MRITSAVSMGPGRAGHAGNYCSVKLKFLSEARDRWNSERHAQAPHGYDFSFGSGIHNPGGTDVIMDEDTDMPAFLRKQAD